MKQIETGPKKVRGKARKTVEQIEAMHRILEEIQPASVRAVCYRLFVEGYIRDMSKAETAKVSRNLVTAREEGTIPWEWVVDENRQPERSNSWDAPADVIRAAVNGYRKDYWQMQPRWIEVWSEKGTIRGTLAPVLEEYGVTLRVMHGYTSATALHDVAEETQENEKPLTVLYVGDWDPSGLNMSECDIPARMKRYEGAADIHRVALRRDDVEGGNLPSFEVASKSKDTRHKWFVENYGERCWELDALPPPTLRERVEDEILRYLDGHAWEQALRVEQAEVASMKEVMGEWQRIVSGNVEKRLGGR